LIEALDRIMPYAGIRISLYGPYLEDAMHEFDISTPRRQAAFIAQLAHESGEFRYVRELATGEAYEGRKDLGNTEPGDGPRFRGRGLIQITGRSNYSACGSALGLDLLGDPALLEAPGPACRSAGWFWHSRGLNDLADIDGFLEISVKINGRNRRTGLPNGWGERLKYWDRAKQALEVV
jgi:putative chitinase